MSTSRQPLRFSGSYGDKEKLLNLVKGLLDKDFPVPCSLFPVPYSLFPYK
ncbi:MAG: hypothetical protein RIE73_11360 [Coleofasciculus sp. C1-SOL-03]